MLFRMMLHRRTTVLGRQRFGCCHRQIPHREFCACFLYVLPVITGVDPQDQFGDGLEELRRLNVHNDYNAYIIAPSFKTTPWCADHDSNHDRRYESFIVQDLVPWVRANLSTSGQEEDWFIGFSKSGFGAVTLLFRNPNGFRRSGGLGSSC